MKIKFLDVSSGLKVGLAIVKDIKIEKSNSEILTLMHNITNKVSEKYNVESINNDVLVKAYRQLYWNFGIDPTKFRPSGEALIKRVVAGKGLYKVNNLVDIFNIFSLETGISIGAHDLDRIKGDIIVRKAEKNEKFIAIGSKRDHLAQGGELCVVDSQKIIDFAFSTSSSDLTKINSQTRNAIVVIYAPKEASLELVQDTLRKISEQVIRHCGGKLEEEKVEIA